jgi:Fibronectin type III domain
MSIAPLKLGLLVMVVLLGPLPGRAQLYRLPNSRVGAMTNTLTIVWEPSPSDQVAGYVLYWGLNSDHCTNRIVLRNVTNATLAGFKAKATYHFAVAAYDAAGEESPLSNVIQYSPTPKSAPTTGGTNLIRLQRMDLGSNGSGLRLSFLVEPAARYQVQATADFQDWEVLMTTNCVQQQKVILDLPRPDAVGQRFFRVLRE